MKQRHEGRRWPEPYRKARKFPYSIEGIALCPGTINTAVEMANLALAHLKEVPIRDFDFSSVASRWFRSHYAAYRDAYLALHDWDFAMRLAPLPAEVEAPPFRWRYQYKAADRLLAHSSAECPGKSGGEQHSP